VVYISVQCNVFIVVNDWTDMHNQFKPDQPSYVNVFF